MIKNKISKFAHKVANAVLNKATACFSIEKEKGEEATTLLTKLTKANQEQTSKALIMETFTKATPSEIALDLGLTVTQYKEFLEHPSIVKASSVLPEVVTRDPAKVLTKGVGTWIKEQQEKNANLHNDDLHSKIGVSLNSNINDEDTEASTLYFDKIEHLKNGEMYIVEVLKGIAEEIMCDDGSEIGGDLDDDIGTQGIMFEVEDDLFESKDEDQGSYFEKLPTPSTVIVKQLLMESEALNKSNSEVSKVAQSSEVIGASKDEAPVAPDVLGSLAQVAVNDIATMGALIIADNMLEACY